MFLAACVWGLLRGDVWAGGPAKFMMAATVDGHRIEGQPLAWTSTKMLLLGRDGVLHEFDNDKAQDARRTADRFRAYSTNQMRERLREEFGDAFEVTVTRNFVVVHPNGRWEAWAERLESLYGSFNRYMKVRGVRLHDPRVPLVAVVFRNHSQYHAHAAASGTPMQLGTLGHYDSQTNRIFLFDVSGQADAGWAVNAETIIHEATHQTAYNVGVHRRFAEQPRWLIEGLAMMFESPGVWKARTIDTRADRVNKTRLTDFLATADTLDGRRLASLVASDNLFRSDPAAAYANAWAFYFYLTETRPRETAAYLQRVAAREPFTQYPGRVRVTDFVQEFGSDFGLLASQMSRFFEDLR